MLLTSVENHLNPNQISYNRIIGKIQGTRKGPTVVFFAGIHGNEKAGVLALKKAFKTFNKADIKGTVYGILGNLKALEKHQRYIETDLNRLWTEERLRNIHQKDGLLSEEQEQKELFIILHEIIKTNTGPLYFIDFHTTSSKTLPFITINDALINRKFSKLFPVPIVLGIEEYLDGPLLSYINQLGYVSLGFESGQHEEEEAIQNSYSFIYLALVFAKVINKEKISDFSFHYKQLKTQSKKLENIFEIVYLHQIQEGEDFKMKKGFKSFQNIKKGVALATKDNKIIFSKYNAKLFMPLYQSKGKEGFFIIKPILPFFLKVSAVLRKYKVDNLLVLLPGISWENNKKKVLVVNLKIAKILAKPIFHLLGYRNKQIDKVHMKLYNRERVSLVEMYKKQEWYN